jgi:hypothetical protein
VVLSHRGLRSRAKIDSAYYWRRQLHGNTIISSLEHPKNVFRTLILQFSFCGSRIEFEIFFFRIRCGGFIDFVFRWRYVRPDSRGSSKRSQINGLSFIRFSWVVISSSLLHWGNFGTRHLPLRRIIMTRVSATVALPIIQRLAFMHTRVLSIDMARREFC